MHMGDGVVYAYVKCIHNPVPPVFIYRKRWVLGK